MFFENFIYNTLIGTSVLVTGAVIISIYKIWNSPDNQNESNFNSINNNNIQLDNMNSVASNTPNLNLGSAVESVSNVRASNNLLETAPISDYSIYNSLPCIPDNISHIIVEGSHQFYIILNYAILSVNPDLMNLFM